MMSNRVINEEDDEQRDPEHDLNADVRPKIIPLNPPQQRRGQRDSTGQPVLDQPPPPITNGGHDERESEDAKQHPRQEYGIHDFKL
jgi:hypothetical protein